jgi:hypothetical protein
MISWTWSKPDGLPLVASTGNAIGYAMESKQRVADTDENTLKSSSMFAKQMT